MDAHIVGSDIKEIQGKTIALDGKEYKLVMDFNAICDMEERYGSFDKAVKVLDGIGSDFSKPGIMKDIRFLLCVMLRHTDEGMTEHKAGWLMTMESMQNITNALGVAMGASMPQGDEKKEASPQEM